LARWAVVRVAAADGQAAQAIVTGAFAPVTMTVDTRPPAAGPEWEIRVQDHTEQELVGVLRRAGVDVLAAKEVLDHPLRRA
jgi:hypothetical protein